MILMSCGIWKSANKRDAEIHLKALRRDGAKLCANYLIGVWSEVDEDSIIVERVTGGLGNQNYYCALQENIKTIDGERREAMIKIYSEKLNLGQSSKGDNEYERLNDAIVAVLIAENNLGPKIFGIFHEGMIQFQFQFQLTLFWALGDFKFIGLANASLTPSPLNNKYGTDNTNEHKIQNI